MLLLATQAAKLALPWNCCRLLMRMQRLLTKSLFTSPQARLPTMTAKQLHEYVNNVRKASYVMSNRNFNYVVLHISRLS